MRSDKVQGPGADRTTACDTRRDITVCTTHPGTLVTAPYCLGVRGSQVAVDSHLVPLPSLMTIRSRRRSSDSSTMSWHCDWNLHGWALSTSAYACMCCPPSLSTNYCHDRCRSIHDVFKSLGGRNQLWGRGHVLRSFSRRRAVSTDRLLGGPSPGPHVLRLPLTLHQTLHCQGGHSTQICRRAVYLLPLINLIPQENRPDLPEGFLQLAPG